MINTFKIFIAALAAFGFIAGQAHAGTVKGTITAKAGATTPAKVNITKDQAVCGKAPLFKEDLIVSKSGGLANAVVEIMGAGAAEAGKVSIANNGCKFDPHVIVVPAESEVTINNNDGITHNFHTFGFENDPLNFSQPGDMKSKTVDEGFESVEVVKIQCDIHEWMSAWAIVTESANIAITGADGTFTIPDVKAGSYKVKIWHEKLGEVVQDITVKDGDNALNLAMGK